MNIKTLETAISEAERFTGKARLALHCRLQPKGEANPYGDGYGPHNAAAKRASMDLTRALAELRKS